MEKPNIQVKQLEGNPYRLENRVGNYIGKIFLSFTSTEKHKSFPYLNIVLLELKKSFLGKEKRKPLLDDCCNLVPDDYKTDLDKACDTIRTQFILKGGIELSRDEISQLYRPGLETYIKIGREIEKALGKK